MGSQNVNFAPYFFQNGEFPAPNFVFGKNSDTLKLGEGTVPLPVPRCYWMYVQFVLRYSATALLL